MKTFFPFNKNETEAMNTWKSYMRTTGWRIIWKKVVAVIDATFAAAERKPEKNSGLYEIRTLDLCGTGAALYQLPCLLYWQCCTGLGSGSEILQHFAYTRPSSNAFCLRAPRQRKKKYIALSPTVIIPRINSSYPRPNVWKPCHSRWKLAVSFGIGSRPHFKPGKRSSLE